MPITQYCTSDIPPLSFRYTPLTLQIYSPNASDILHLCFRYTSTGALASLVHILQIRLLAHLHNINLCSSFSSHKIHIHFQWDLFRSICEVYTSATLLYMLQVYFRYTSGTLPNGKGWHFICIVQIYPNVSVALKNDI